MRLLLPLYARKSSGYSSKFSLRHKLSTTILILNIGLLQLILSLHCQMIQQQMKQRSARLESGRSLTPHLRQNLRTSTFCQIFILNLLIQLLAGQTQAYAGQRGQSCRYSRPPRGKDVDGLHPST
ncbi:hypothetical protein ACQ4LE_006981 [Meloidogyne hapla]